MYSRILKSVCRVLALACVVLMPVALVAQGSSRPAVKADSGDTASRWDIFAGYSYLAPKGTVNVPQPSGATVPFSYDSVNVGGLGSVAYFFNRYVGAQAEIGIHEWGKGSDTSGYGADRRPRPQPIYMGTGSDTRRRNGL